MEKQSEVNYSSSDSVEIWVDGTYEYEVQSQNYYQLHQLGEDPLKDPLQGPAPLTKRWLSNLWMGGVVDGAMCEWQESGSCEKTSMPTPPPQPLCSHHVMSCHRWTQWASIGRTSSRYTHTHTPMEWAPGEGPRAPCMARRREVPGPSKVHHGQASGRSETPVPPKGPGFLGTGGSHLWYNGPQVRGGREHHAWREEERRPDQARSTTGRRADAQKHQSRRQAPAFWELVGLTLDDRRAHSRHTW